MALSAAHVATGRTITDFFISYTGVGSSWVEWIAYWCRSWVKPASRPGLLAPIVIFPSWGWKRRPRATNCWPALKRHGKSRSASGFSRRSGIQSAGISRTLTRQVPPAADGHRKTALLKQSFSTIRALFEAGLQALPQDQGLDHDFTAKNETDFRAEIFLEGRGRCVCCIWLGGMHSENNICYSEGRTMSDNSCNEIISLSDRRDELALTAEMAMGYTQFERTLDLKRLNPDEAANYLWHCFVEPLER